MQREDKVRDVSQFVELVSSGCRDVWVSPRFWRKDHERLKGLYSKCGVCRWRKESRRRTIELGEASQCPGEQ